MATRTTPPPKTDHAAEKAFKEKAAALAPKYRTELLKPGPLEALAQMLK